MTLEEVKVGEYVERYVPNSGGSISVRVCKVGLKYLYIDPAIQKSEFWKSIVGET
jgi:hypothetical protein